MKIVVSLYIVIKIFIRYNPYILFKMSFFKVARGGKDELKAVPRVIKPTKTTDIPGTMYQMMMNLRESVN